ncbi:MAG TPA: hypothetical protein DEB70_02245 [Planctomycetaceae bacterium]|nr:hypothetical protein [Planctomycetaceae bacterium]
MSAVPLTDSLSDIAERKKRMLDLLKKIGLSGVYACVVFALSAAAFLGSSYYLSHLASDIAASQSIATNFATD